MTLPLLLVGWEVLIVLELRPSAWLRASLRLPPRPSPPPSPRAPEPAAADADADAADDNDAAAADAADADADAAAVADADAAGSGAATPGATRAAVAAACVRCAVLLAGLLLLAAWRRSRNGAAPAHPSPWP